MQIYQDLLCNAPGHSRVMSDRYATNLCSGILWRLCQVASWAGQYLRWDNTGLRSGKGWTHRNRPQGKKILIVPMIELKHLASIPSIFSSHRARFFLAWRQVVWQVEGNGQEPAGSRDDRWTNAQKIITPLFFISKDKDKAGNQFTQHIKLKVTTSKVTWPKTTPFKYTKHFFHYTNSKLVVGRCWSIKKTHPHLPPLYNLCKWGDAFSSLLSF